MLRTYGELRGSPPVIRNQQLEHLPRPPFPATPAPATTKAVWPPATSFSLALAVGSASVVVAASSVVTPPRSSRLNARLPATSFASPVAPPSCTPAMATFCQNSCAASIAVQSSSGSSSSHDAGPNGSLKPYPASPVVGFASRQHAEHDDHLVLVDEREPHPDLAYPEAPLGRRDVLEPHDVTLVGFSELHQCRVDLRLVLLTQAPEILLRTVGDLELPAQSPSSFFTSSSVCTRPAL